jgi:hypothetical protein
MADALALGGVIAFVQNSEMKLLEPQAPLQTPEEVRTTL